MLLADEDMLFVLEGFRVGLTPVVPASVPVKLQKWKQQGLIDVKCVQPCNHSRSICEATKLPRCSSARGALLYLLRTCLARAEKMDGCGRGTSK